ncbi:Elongator complex protein 6 [Apostasia shenzhenica]|uniref:Elongator complex protein 6 n=1 Tax=Apostasia shenzhenica TaxID=1088818 RepID=A0A2I0BGJ2_9ASPA|nr:Elongator complex protein 6 [Apostasia shenzhenica]
MNQTSNLLDEALGLGDPCCAGALSPERIVLIEDCVETSGAFVLHHLVKRALSPVGGVVLFLALAHPFTHYDRILKKLGCNLSIQKDNNRLYFLDMLGIEFPDEMQWDAIEDGLVKMYSKIQGAIEGCSSSDQSCGHISIVIDDLSILEIAARGSVNHDCSLVILNHEDIYQDKEAPKLLSHLLYLAHFIVKAEPLVTGLAVDVHGQLTILKKGNIQNNIYTERARNFHFQVKENGVELFLPGSRC